MSRTLYDKLWDEHVVCAEEDGTAQLADLRVVIHDPLFTDFRPDLAQMRASLVHAPSLVQAFMTLYRSYQNLSDQLLALSQNEAPQLATSAEAAVHRVAGDLRDRMRRVTDPYLRERLADIEDMVGRLLAALECS